MIKISNKKMGRPTDNPKIYSITLRIDKETNDSLEKYCVQNRISKTEAIRVSITRLVSDIKK